MGDGRDGFEVGHFERRIGNGFGEQRAGIGVDGGGEIVGIVGIDEAHLDAEVRQDVLELGVGAAVEVSGGNDVVARLGEVDDRVEDRAGAGSHGHGAEFGRAFEQGNAFFKHLGGRVGQPGVDVSEFLQGEEIGRLFGAVEHERAGAVEWHRGGAGGGVAGVAAVQGDGFEVEGHAVRLVGDWDGKLDDWLPDASGNPGPQAGLASDPQPI